MGGGGVLNKTTKPVKTKTFSFHTKNHSEKPHECASSVLFQGRIIRRTLEFLFHRTCKQYLFLLSFRNVSSVLLCESLSTSPARAGTAPLAALVLWLCTRCSSVTEDLLWLPRYKSWAQHRMTEVIIKGTAIWKVMQYFVWRIVQYTWS